MSRSRTKSLNMFRSRNRARGGKPNDQSSVLRQRLRGFFKDGFWHCDCNPRHPANRFETRKEGSNCGRWFYTCQEPRSSRTNCGFFLWEDEAVHRMEGAVLNNSTTEPQAVFAAKSPVDELHDFATTSTISFTLSPPSTPKALPKRKLPWQQDSLNKLGENDERLPWPLSGAEKFDLAQATISPFKPPDQLVTPRKTAKVDVFTTPGSHRCPDGAENGLFTPNTTLNNEISSFKLLDSISKFNPSDLVSPDTTPTPARFRYALSHLPHTPVAGDKEITQEVFALLKTAKVSIARDTEDLLRSLLRKHALRRQGIVKGRELTRMTLKAREETIAKLQLRVAELEAEAASIRAAMRHMRSSGTRI